MGTKNNPGKFDAYAKAEPDEPMFTLLARDPLAPMLIRMWAAQRWAEHEDAEKVAEARACADAMDRWRAQRGSSPALAAVEEEERHAAVSIVTWPGDEDRRGPAPVIRVLCVWNERYQGWSLPGGMREPGETSEEAQARELREETGLMTLRARLVFSGRHNIKAVQGAARPGRASIVDLFRVEVSGVIREESPTRPVEWKTVAEFLAGSPFSEFYEPLLYKYAAEAA